MPKETQKIEKGLEPLKKCRYEGYGLQPASQSAISGTTTYMNLSYNFHLGSGDNGNLYAITNVKDSTRSQAFTYDTLNRILTADTPNPSSHSWGIGFTIDPFGNLTQTNPIAGMVNFPMSVNQQVNTKNQFTLLGYSYDAAGEALNDGLSSGCSGNGYAWTAEGMQSCANGTTYTYDGDEERVKKSNGTLYWGGGAGAALAESDLSGNLTSEYIFFNGQRIAVRNMSTHVVSYYVLDHLGSTSLLVDAAGNIINDSDYTPYGGEMPFTTGNPGQHYKFTGKERDAETGNDYFGARYFANSMGRWLSPDWSAKVEPVPYSKLDDPQSLNLYSYVGNNPMMRVDPDGHDGPDRFGCSEDQKDCNTTPPPTKKPDTKSAQQVNGNAVSKPSRFVLTNSRALMGAEGTADILVGAGKIGGAAAFGVKAEAAGPFAPVFALGAAYAGISGSVQIVQGSILLGGAATGHTQDARTTSDFLGAVSTISGFTALVVTEDAPVAAHVSSFEGLLTGAATRSIFDSMHDFTDTVLNGKDLVTAKPSSTCSADVCTGSNGTNP